MKCPGATQDGSEPCQCQGARCQLWGWHPCCSQICFYPSQQHPGDVAGDSHRLTPALQQEFWGEQPARLPVLPVLLILVFARGGECLRVSPADPARALGWSGVTGHTPGTHLAHSMCPAPGGFLQDPACPAPSDSPEHLWTLQREGEGSRSRAGNYRGSIPWGLGPLDR